MRERAEELGGTCTVTSAAGGGHPGRGAAAARRSTAREPEVSRWTRCASWWSTTTTSSGAGLEALLAATDAVEVVGSAADGRDGGRLALDLQPDVVLMDLHMPRLNGIEATARIVQSSPHIGVLVLTMMEDEDSVFAAVRAGARGYLLKGARRGEIVRAIEAVGAGEVIFGPGIADRMMTYFRGVRTRSRPPTPSRSSPSASGSCSA